MKFPVKKYLEHYYKDIGVENQHLIEFYAKHRDRIPFGGTHLEIAGGPTIYQIISIAPRVSKIIYTDVSVGAAKHIKSWIKNKTGAFDWDHFLKEVLKLEGVNNSHDDINKRSEIIRSKFHKYLIRDLSKEESILQLGKKYGPFNTISSNFAIEAFTFRIDQFRKIIKAIYNILDEGGIFSMLLVEECKEYQIGKVYLKTLYINRNQLIKELINAGFDKNMIIEFQDTEDIDYGYKGIILLSCTKGKKDI